MAVISAELKGEILALSAKEKDKLLLRLIAKNDILIEQLQFQLVEESLTTESRRQDVQLELDKIYQKRNISSAQLYLEMRAASALITRHVKVTKDKYGEVDLLLNLLYDPFDMKPHLFSDLNRANDKISYYIAKRTVLFLKKLNALNEELKLDFLSKTNTLLDNIHSSSTVGYALSLGIPEVLEL
jgi:hypothetical protein